MIAVSPVDISPATTGSYQDVDITAHVGSDAGDVAGVILEIINTNAATERVWGVRNNGSTDTLEKVAEDKGHWYAAVGVDSNDIFEAYIDHADVTIILVGYVINAEGGFVTNAVDKSLGSTGAWADIDISSDTGADTAKFALFHVENVSGTTDHNYGFRENGSTDSRLQLLQWDDAKGAFIGVDENEIAEMQIASTDVNCYLMGWLTDNVTSFTNAKDYSENSTTGSYVDVDMSTDVPTGNDGVFFNSFSAGAELNHGIRKNGTSYDNYRDVTEQMHGWVQTDPVQTIEQKIESTSMDLYITGYTSRPRINFDAASSGQVDAASSLTFSHTVGIGDNTTLIVAVAAEDNANAADLPVTGVTYNGVAMTKIREDAKTASDDDTCSLWYLHAPATGANNVVISWTGAVEGGIGSAQSFFGVAQVAQEADSGGDTIAQTSITATLTTIADNALTCAIVLGQSSGIAITTTSGEEASNVTNSGNLRAATSYILDNYAAGSKSLTWTMGSANDEVHSMVSFAPAVVAAVDKTFTIDAIIATRVDKTFTIDGIVLASIDKTFTIDGVVLVKVTKTFTIDGIVLVETTVTFTIDGIILAETTKTFTIDGIVLAETTKTFTIDGLVLVQETKTFTIDGLVLATTDKTFTIDAIVLVQTDKTFTIDGIVLVQVTKTFTIDGLVLAQTTETFTIDGIVLVQTDKTFTIDGVVLAQTDKTFTVDGIVLASTDKTFTIDGLVSAAGTKTFTIDGIVFATNTQTFTIDGIVSAQTTKTFTIEGLVLAQTTNTFTIDGVVLAQTTKTFTLDGVVLAQTIKTFTIDGIVFAANSTTFTIDGLIIATATKTFTIDGLITVQETNTFTIDGIISAQTTVIFTIDGVIEIPKNVHIDRGSDKATLHDNDDTPTLASSRQSGSLYGGTSESGLYRESRRNEI